MDPVNPNDETVKLLLIDSHPEQYTDLLAAASAHGFAPQTATTATAAREILERPGHGISAILLSLDLPDIAGDDFLEWIKITNPQIAVIVGGENHDEQILVRCLNKGAADFRIKNSQIPETISALKLVTRRQKTLVENIGDMRATVPVCDWVELVAQTETEYLGRIQRFCDVLFRKRLPQKIVDDLRLALEEFGRNAIEWGNRYDRNKKFSIRYAIIDNEMILVFEDEGEGFDWMKGMTYDPSKDPIAHLKSRQAIGKRPGGFGLFMMRNMMDEVFYNAKGNVCVMKKSLAEKPENENMA